MEYSMILYGLNKCGSHKKYIRVVFHNSQFIIFKGYKVAGNAWWK